MLGFGVSQLIYGSLADKFGRKIVILVGMLIYISASIFCVLTTNIDTLIWLRLLQGIGAASGMAISRAIIADVFPPQQMGRVFAIVFTFVGISPAIATVIGGFLTEYFMWQSNFIFLFIIGTVLLLLVVFGYKETLKIKLNVSILSLVYNYYSLLQNSLFIRYAIMVMAGSTAYFSYFTASPLIFSILNVSSSSIDFLYAIIAGAYMLGNTVAQRSVKKYTMDQLLFMASCLFIFGALLMLGLNYTNNFSILSLSLPILIIAFGNGFIMPFGFASSLSLNPSLAGTASGLVGFLQMGSASLGAKLIAIMSEKYNIQIMPYLLPTMALICFISINSIILTKKSK